jgi:hypothetical protein
MNAAIHKAHRKLVAGGAVAGALSAAIFLIGGYHTILLILGGALLGGCMAEGVAAINRLEARRAASGGQAGDLPILGIALLAGLIPAIPIGWGYTVMMARPQSLGITYVFWRTAVVCLFYSVPLIMLYRLRRRMRLRRVVYLMLLAGLCCGMLRGFWASTALPGRGSVGRLWFTVFSGLLGGLPFAALWTWAVCRLDPAFSPERWQRLHASAPEGAVGTQRQG